LWLDGDILKMTTFNSADNEDQHRFEKLSNVFYFKSVNKPILTQVLLKSRYI